MNVTAKNNSSINTNSSKNVTPVKMTEVEYPMIIPQNYLIPLTSQVVFTYFLGLPLLVLMLYIFWMICQKCIVWIDNDEYSGSQLEVEDVEPGVIDNMAAVAPILSKLSPDFLFPPVNERINATDDDKDGNSDVLRSSNGSLISLPGLCSVIRLCPCLRKKNPSNLEDPRGEPCMKCICKKKEKIDDDLISHSTRYHAHSTVSDIQLPREQKIFAKVQHFLLKNDDNTPILPTRNNSKDKEIPVTSI